MRPVAVVILALAFGCDGSSSGTDDGGGGDGDIVPDGSGTSAHTVKVTLTNRPMNAAPFSFVVAYQDGSAPWQLAPAPSGDVYTLPINAPVWGVAFACSGSVVGTTTSQLRTVTAAHFAIGERTELTLDVPARCSDRATNNVTLTGAITNRPFTGVLVVQFGTRAAFVNGMTGAFSLTTPPGTHDLIVAQAIPEGNGEFYVESTVVQRNVAITGATTRTINFAQAVPTDAWPVTLGAARAVAATTLYTANGTQLGTTRETTDPYTVALDPSQALTTDVYDQAISVTTLSQSATITNATNNPGPQTWVAPTPLGVAPTAVVTKSPYITLESTWAPYVGAIGYTWNAQQQLSSMQCGGNVACTIAWSALVSPGVLGTNPGYRMPDLSDVMGWKMSFEFAGGAQIVGGVTATTSSAGAGDFPTGIPAAGTKRTFVRTDYAVTP